MACSPCLSAPARVAHGLREKLQKFTDDDRRLVELNGVTGVFQGDDVRRCRLVTASIELGTRWTVFEANDEALWSKLTEDVSAFLESLWSSGALRGSTPDEAFFVRCDASTMTSEDLDNGRVPILVGFAPAVTPEVSTPLTITVRAAPRSVPDHRISQ